MPGVPEGLPGEMVLIILGIVCNTQGEEGFLARTVDAARIFGTLVVLQLVIRGARHLLEGVGQEALLRRGERVWRLYLLADVPTAVLGLIPVPEGLGTVGVVVLNLALVFAVLGIGVTADTEPA